MKYVITDSSNVVVFIVDSVSYSDSGRPIINGNSELAFECKVHSVDSIPDGVSTVTHCYDGSEFTYNPSYPFEQVALDNRSSLLAETDWTQTLDAPITKECSSAFRTYRQALRDITEQEGYPYTITWPEKPEVVKGSVTPVDTTVDSILTSSLEG